MYRQLKQGLLVAMLMSCFACSNDDVTSAEANGPAVELARATAMMPAAGRLPVLKIRELVEDQAYLALEDAQDAGTTGLSNNAEIELPTLIPLTYKTIHIAVDESAAKDGLIVDLQPALKEEHWLMFFINDEPVGSAIPIQKNKLVLPRLAHGEHRLRVDILDESLMVLQSSRPHIIYVENKLSQASQPLAAK